MSCPEPSCGWMTNNSIFVLRMILCRVLSMVTVFMVRMILPLLFSVIAVLMAAMTVTVMEVRM